MGYEAPEVRYYIDVDEEDNDKGHVYTNAVDIWSLGCVAYQIRARQLPFPTSRQLKRYCDGKTPFPTQPLIEDTSASGIEFLKIFLCRPHRYIQPLSEAIQAAWLCSEDLSAIGLHQSSHNLSDSHDAAREFPVLLRPGSISAPPDPIYRDEAAENQFPSHCKELIDSVGGSIPWSMSEDGFNCSPSWYASSPGIKPTSIPLNGGDEVADIRVIPQSTDLLKGVWIGSARTFSCGFHAYHDKAPANIGDWILVWATIAVDLQCIYILIAAGPYINSTDSDGYSAPHFAEIFGYVEMAQRILPA